MRASFALLLRLAHFLSTTGWRYQGTGGETASKREELIAWCRYCAVLGAWSVGKPCMPNNVIIIWKSFPLSNCNPRPYQIIYYQINTHFRSVTILSRFYDIVNAQLILVPPRASRALFLS